MRILSTDDPEIWEARSSGHGPLFLFGLPFLLVGLFVMSTPLGVIPLEGDSPPAYIMVPFGMIFTLVGLGLIAGRKSVLIDRRRGRMVKGYGLLIPMIRREQTLGLCDRLALEREVRKTDKSTQTVYPVRLEGGGQGKAILIEEPADYKQARATAESLAEFLCLPLADRSSGKEVVREPDRLDESIRDRARRNREEMPEAVAPPRMRSILREESGTLTIQIPPRGVTAAHRFQLLGFLLFVGAAVFVLRPFLEFEVQDPKGLLLVGLIGAGALLLPASFLVSRLAGQARMRATVQASRGLLRVEQGKKVTEIFADELEELEIHESKLPAGITRSPEGRWMIDKGALREGSRHHRFAAAGNGETVPLGPVLSCLMTAVLPMGAGPRIMARSDKNTVWFGAGLDREELFFLYTRLRKILAG